MSGYWLLENTTDPPPPVLAATPTFSPVSGGYVTPVSVTLSDSTPAATIYYTLDGTTPTITSTVYTAPIVLPLGTTTIQAIATAAGFTTSAVGTSSYAVSPVTPPPPPVAAATPTFSPPTGGYAPPLSVTLADSTPGATIYYTTDGTLPTISSAVYGAPIALALGATTIQAIATAAGFIPSTIGAAAYAVGYRRCVRHHGPLAILRLHAKPGTGGQSRLPSLHRLDGDRALDHALVLVRILWALDPAQLAAPDGPMTRIMDADIRHARLIAASMRPRDAEEVRAGWGREPYEAMREALSASYYARTMFQGFEPLVMYGLAPLTVLGGSARFWIFSSAAIDRHRFAFARGCKRHLPELWNHCTLATNFIDLGDKSALKWLLWMGGTCALRPEVRGGRLFAQFILVDRRPTGDQCQQA
jgi:hypothetical protein